MFPQLGRRGAILLSLFVVVFILACGIVLTPDTNNPPAFDFTKMALEFQATAMSLQLTQAALNSQPLPQPTSPPPPISTYNSTRNPPTCCTH